MEDRLGMAENETHIVLGAFDGHSGHELAQWCASRVCTEVLTQGFEHVQSILDRVDKEFKETHVTCVPNLKNQNVGTTVTIAVIDKRPPYATRVAWLGDSRAAAFDADHQRVWCTVDHDLYNEAEIKGVEARGGRVVGRDKWYGPRIAGKNGDPMLNMSRALGNADLEPWVGKTIETMDLDSLVGRTLVVATDGLWNSGKDFSELLSDPITPESARLALHAFEYDDNISFFIVQPLTTPDVAREVSHRTHDEVYDQGKGNGVFGGDPGRESSV